MRIIDDRFELVERLGSGGMGLVWRARDLALHREVAIKEVRPPDSADVAEEIRGRVLREAQALARLNHPHVVTIHHIVEDRFPWIVMELVQGGSLQDRLAHGPLPPHEVARLGREVLSALRAAHSVGILHRDVKPANVLLRPDGSSVLTDFGIAAVRETPNLTATGSFIGSPEYMAPERVNGYEGNPASDLWSLGMLLYVAVEGRHPMRRQTVMATLAAVLQGEIPQPERAGPLAPVLAALLRRDPAARPDPDSLDRMLAGGLTGSMTMPMRPRPKRGLAVGVTTAVVAAVVALGVVGWNLIPRTQIQDPGTTFTPPASSLPKKSATTEPSDEPTQQAQQVNLHTAAGMQVLMAQVKRLTGGTKVVSLAAYPTYASFNAPVKTDKEVYDTYFFRDGTAGKQSKGSKIDNPPVDLARFDWNRLPALFRKADRVLGVRKPTTHYLVIDPGFASLFGNSPFMMIYVGDDYRTAYLVADAHGRVIKTYPA
ncbi:serine/threonine-protein kinase [Nonomuraea sp. NPDC050536]|uniref:serine/threonine-protein kinase n=1 Tax=Nonomuraea sp. NPDC050536 TaxID=3364366 RepID=UPI0037CC58AE